MLLLFPPAFFFLKHTNSFDDRRIPPTPTCSCQTQSSRNSAQTFSRPSRVPPFLEKQLRSLLHRQPPSSPYPTPYFCFQSHLPIIPFNLLPIFCLAFTRQPLILLQEKLPTKSEFCLGWGISSAHHIFHRMLLGFQRASPLKQQYIKGPNSPTFRTRWAQWLRELFPWLKVRV